MKRHVPELKDIVGFHCIVRDRCVCACARQGPESATVSARHESGSEDRTPRDGEGVSIPGRGEQERKCVLLR